MNKILRSSKRFLSRNMSNILTGVGGIGIITSAVMAAKATPKALELLEQEKIKKGDDLTKIEKLKTASPVYIPTAIVVCSTLACVFGANILNKRKQASLISAYALLDQTHKKYKNKVELLYGVESTKKIRDGLIKDEYRKLKNDEDDKELFYDDISKRYFRSTKKNVMMAEYQLNKEFVDECCIPLNRYYELLGIDLVDYGNQVGWSSPALYEMYWSSWINFNYEEVVMDDGLECCIVSITEPMFDFENY